MLIKEDSALRLLSYFYVASKSERYGPEDVGRFYDFIGDKHMSVRTQTPCNLPPSLLYNCGIAIQRPLRKGRKGYYTEVRVFENTVVPRVDFEKYITAAELAGMGPYIGDVVMRALLAYIMGVANMEEPK